MATELRKTGISVVGDVPWGTHFCHFYETKQDLLDTLVPYFKAGLESKEFCVWVVSNSELITVEEAKEALAQAVPDLDRHLADENIEILNGLEWYLEENVFNLERVASAWDAKLKRALALGYDGMRVSGDTFWLRETDWKDFCAYEKQLNDSITDQPMTVLCTYPLAKSGASEVLDVVRAHQFAIARRQGEWEVIETPELTQARAEIKRLNEELEQRVIERTNELGVANEGLRKEIAERKQAEDELRRQKEILQQIFDHIPVMINFVEADGRIKLVNSEWERTLGWSLDEIRQQNLDVFAECYPDPQYRQQVLKFVAEAEGKWADFKTRVRDGRVIDTAFVRVHLSDGTSIGIGKNITERKQAEEALDERLRFETLVTELSAAFANLSPNEVDREIDKWLQTLAEFLGVDRASFFQFEEDWTTLYRSHSYTVPGIEPLPRAPIGMKDQFPWITDQLRRGVTVNWSRIPDDMPEEAAKEKEYAARFGVKSGLNIPVRMGGSVICAITFTSITTYRDWPDAMVARLRLVGEIFAAAVERKRAEAALLKSEERFRQIAENLQDVIWMVDSRVERLLYVNPAYEKIWGASSASLYRDVRAFMEPVHPDDREIVVRMIEATKRTKLVTAEYRIIRPDGAVHWIRDRSFPVRNAEGEVYRIAGVAEDITESKQAEEKLRQSESQLAEAQRLAKVGSWNWDIRNDIHTWSDELYHMYGLHPQESEPSFDTFIELVHPDDRAAIVAAIEHALKAQESINSYLRIIRPDGAERIIHSRGNTISDISGTPIRMYGTVQDVTERKQAEEAQREAERKYRDIFENAGEGIFQSTPDGRFIAANPALARMHGFASPEELIHSRLDISRQIYVDPSRREEFKSQLEEHGAVRGFEHEVFRKDGSRLWISVNAHAVRDKQGKTQYYEGTAQDINERKAAEKKLKASSEQLRALSARLQSAREEEGTRIAREIHDELGSALTSLKWDLEEIDKQLSTPLEPLALVALREKLQTSMKLVDLAITAIRRIASELRPSVLDDLGLVAAIEWQCQQFQSRTGIVSVCDCSLEKAELTEEQSTAVFRILQEALTNVLRHSHAAKVDIKTNKENGYFVLSVSDNGKGIIESVKSEQESLGILGMRERAHLIGGEIDIKGVGGKGTVVTVRVPISQDRVLKMTR